MVMNLKLVRVQKIMLSWFCSKLWRAAPNNVHISPANMPVGPLQECPPMRFDFSAQSDYESMLAELAADLMYDVEAVEWTDVEFSRCTSASVIRNLLRK